MQSGTPGYMAPEVMLQRNHSYNADFFALGVIATECMTGKRPYKGKSKDKIRDAILASQAEVKIERGDPWDDYPQEAADFINACIQKNPRERIQNFEEIKSHPYFNGFDWEGLLNKTIEPIYIPSADLIHNIDRKNVDDFDYEDAELLKEHIRELNTKEGQEIFARFNYNLD
uniref:non-specific serine/threonine protein kinase n=1 Tax=Strombidium inclinatum TaxID=197538 RepID=A0A7S3IDF4_9SPIT|mmetsp:Transcript_1247/g.1461  ORF Transcript_1247/g.1461 Transcript_1247/m.1461 type:complete len:172 (+) Transcript_1247:535-1050(+)